MAEITFEEWWSGLSPSDFRMTLEMTDDDRIKYFCKKAWELAREI